MSLKLGVLGYGNMASAILNSAGVGALVCDICAGRRDIAKDAGFDVTDSPDAVCESCDVILLSVKPNQLSDLLAGCKSQLEGKCFVSVAAGVSRAAIGEALGGGVYVIRVMPNLPVSLGVGSTVVAACSDVPQHYLDFAKRLFKGYTVEIDEDLINIATSLNGSSPAVYYLMAEVMAVRAAELGVDSVVALKLAAHAMQGAAAMLIESDCTPEELRRAVCSPGGTTLAMLDALDRGGFSETLRDGITACAERARELGTGSA